MSKKSSTFNLLPTFLIKVITPRKFLGLFIDFSLMEVHLNKGLKRAFICEERSLESLSVYLTDFFLGRGGMREGDGESLVGEVRQLPALLA